MPVEYELPEELIAQEAPAERDGGRLMVVHRGTAAPPVHAAVRDLPGWLESGDVLVVNRSRVIPARLRGRRLPGGGAVEILLVAPSGERARWRALARPAKRLRDGQEIEIRPFLPGERPLVLTVHGRGDGEVEVAFPEDVDVDRWLERAGEPPLPPYIRRPEGPHASDAERYQTVFAREPGSIAAPTAGLHLSHDLLDRIRARGIRIAEVVLHVGPATFLAGQPGRSALAVEPERYRIPDETRALLLDRTSTRRVVAVGTTTTRALEAAARAGWPEGEQRTDLVLQPGATFAAVDALLTNFHLPGSSLLALVAAFAGEETVRRAYAAAVAARYRFYSYGDAMLLT
jgi:S-adenosylmethionine:tRNA ribosyltransferase-isomerase